MKAKIWIGAMLFIALIVATMLVLASCQDKSGEVQFSTGCNDIFDVTILPQDKKIETCNELISSKITDLESMGFEPEDCQVIEAEAEDCEPALGTRLVCTYRCGDNAE
jgi:type II secretory pathway component PulL